MTSISPDTVRRILEHHHPTPWRYHLGLSPEVPRDAAFAAVVREICDLDTRSPRFDLLTGHLDHTFRNASSGKGRNASIGAPSIGQRVTPQHR